MSPRSVFLPGECVSQELVFSQERVSPRSVFPPGEYFSQERVNSSEPTGSELRSDLAGPQNRDLGLAALAFEWP